MKKKDKERKELNQKTEEVQQAEEQDVLENKETADNQEVAENEAAAENEETEVEKMKKQIDELQKEVAVTKNAYFKAYADADNLKKRLQADAENANKYRIQSFAINILPALDSLELALAGKDTNDPFVKGVKLTYDSIMHALSNEGITQVDCLNKEFDPSNAQAMMTEKVEGVEPNMVVDVLQKGYMLKDRLLRAALVKVSE